ncbi:MAG: hypothetical protein ABIZ80_03710 [Bryobacteraceae bacterium]
MFFRREKAQQITFTQRMEELRRIGFTVDALDQSHMKVSRDGAAIVLENVAGDPDAPPRVSERAGIVFGKEIATLVDGGYQKFFQTPSGKRKPALAEDLKNVHAFQEDLWESLGMTSLYNESLGTVSNRYLYDRVQNRDRGVPKRAWE